MKGFSKYAKYFFIKFVTNPHGYPVRAYTAYEGVLSWLKGYVLKCFAHSYLTMIL
jgi:hypothetical protein